MNRDVRIIPILMVVAALGAGAGPACSKTPPAAETTAGAAPAAASPYQPIVIKFADPGNAGALAVAKRDGRLARELAKVNATVEWVPGASAFSANFEAMNAGAINASGAAISPIVGALAHNLQFKIFSISDRPRSRQAGIIVPASSPVRSVADLVGKRVAVNQAAHGDYILLRALENAGVPAAKVERVAIQPPDAAAAFATGKIDGWSTFGVFFATAVRNGARVIAYEADIESDDVGVTAANVALLEKNPAAFQVFVRVLRELIEEGRQNPEKFQNVFTSSGPTAVTGDLLALAIEETRILPAPHVPVAEDRVRVGNVSRIFFDHKSIDRLVAVDDIVFDIDEAARKKGYPQ